MKITLVMPSFNQGKYIDEAIRSVVSQSDFLHEFFIFDGGSTDETLSIIRKHSPRITYWVSERDHGQSDAIIKGFSRATGDVLCWLNSDDVLLPGALKRIKQTFEQNPGCQVVTGGLVNIDSDSRILLCRHAPGHWGWRYRFGPVSVMQQSTFFARKLYVDVGGIDIALHHTMDVDLWARFYRQRPLWLSVNDYVGGFRRHGAVKGDNPQGALAYRSEKELWNRKYPELSRTLPQMLGQALHRADQLVSGRGAQVVYDNMRYRTRHVMDAFGRW